MAGMQHYLMDQLGCWKFCLICTSGTVLKGYNGLELDKRQKKWAFVSPDATTVSALGRQFFCS
jgi:hypothetical protein